MRDHNEPSILDHDAPYNVGEDGNCECYYCLKQQRKEQMEDYLYEQERERRWLKEDL